MNYVYGILCLAIFGLIAYVAAKKLLKKSEPLERDPNMRHAEVEVRDENFDMADLGKLKPIKNARKKVSKKKKSSKKRK